MLIAHAGKFTVLPHLTFVLLNRAYVENDWDIPYTHSEILFNAFLDPLLPSVDLPSDPVSTSKEDWSAFTAQIAARKSQREVIVTTTRMPNFGVMEEFVDRGGEITVGGERVRGGEYLAAGPPGGGAPREREIIFVKTLEGNHDDVGVQEGLQDIIGTKFGLLAPPLTAETLTVAPVADSVVGDVDGSEASEAGSWSPLATPSDRGDWSTVAKIVD